MLIGAKPLLALARFIISRLSPLKIMAVAAILLRPLTDCCSSYRTRKSPQMTLPILPSPPMAQRFQSPTGWIPKHRKNANFRCNMSLPMPRIMAAFVSRLLKPNAWPIRQSGQCLARLILALIRQLMPNFRRGVRRMSASPQKMAAN